MRTSLEIAARLAELTDLCNAENQQALLTDAVANANGDFSLVTKLMAEFAGYAAERAKLTNLLPTIENEERFIDSIIGNNGVKKAMTDLALTDVIIRLRIDETGKLVAERTDVARTAKVTNTTDAVKPERKGLVVRVDGTPHAGWNAAARAYGAASGMNAAAAERFLIKHGAKSIIVE